MPPLAQTSRGLCRSLGAGAASLVIAFGMGGCRRTTTLGQQDVDSSPSGAARPSGSPGPSGSSGSSGTAEGTGGSSPCPDTFDALILSPASIAETIQAGSANDVPFSVAGIKDGASTPLDPALLNWSASRADDTDPGSVSAGLFHPFSGAGGQITVTASGCGATGVARVSLMLNFETHAGAGSGPTEADFSGSLISGDAVHAPKITYPTDQTRFPRNVYDILFQWRKGKGSRFRLTFTGAASTVRVYTDGSDPGCAGAPPAYGCWRADPATWNAIAGSNAGATVSVEVDGATPSGASVYASMTETIGFSRHDVKGAIYFWAANVGGIQRARVGDAAPVSYLVGPQVGAPTVLPNGDAVNCVACHAVSRDGKRMAVSGSVAAGGSTPVSKGLWVLDVTDAPPPTPAQLSFPGAPGDGFSAFSPDDRKLIWSTRKPSALPLRVLDADTGRTLADAMVNGQPIAGTAPDWSPRTDADEIAFADTAGGISTLRWDGGSFSAPQQIAPPMGGQNDAFPNYSPDGTWIAFTNGNASLFLVPAAGGTPIALTAASTRVNNQTSNPRENSMPTWAPRGDLDWVAFNSKRPYGAVTAGGTNQLWVAAIDFAQLDGGDPSYPAFRLPFQDLNAKNHRAFWAHDTASRDGGELRAGRPSSGGSPGTAVDAGVCPATGAPCDPNGTACCDQNSLGAFCEPGDAGANICQLPVF